MPSLVPDSQFCMPFIIPDSQFHVPSIVPDSQFYVPLIVRWCFPLGAFDTSMQRSSGRRSGS